MAGTSGAECPSWTSKCPPLPSLALCSSASKIILEVLPRGRWGGPWELGWWAESTHFCKVLASPLCPGLAVLHVPPGPWSALWRRYQTVAGEAGSGCRLVYHELSEWSWARPRSYSLSSPRHGSEGLGPVPVMLSVLQSTHVLRARVVHQTP